MALHLFLRFDHGSTLILAFWSWLYCKVHRLTVALLFHRIRWASTGKRIVRSEKTLLTSTPVKPLRCQVQCDVPCVGGRRQPIHSVRVTWGRGRGLAASPRGAPALTHQAALAHFCAQSEKRPREVCTLVTQLVSQCRIHNGFGTWSHRHSTELSSHLIFCVFYPQSCSKSYKG